MLVLLVCENEETGSRYGPALRDRLAEGDNPAAWVDGFGLTARRPQAQTDLFIQARDILEAAIEAMETSGVRRYVVGVPTALVPRLPELAFFLRRRQAQRCFVLTPDGAPTEWAQSAARTIQASESPALLRSWEPEVPRVETPRLVLTFATHDQTAGYFRSIAGTSIFDMLVWDGPKTEAELHDWSLKMRRQFAKGPTHSAGFAVIAKSTGRQIGAIGGNPMARNPGRWTIGYSLAPQWHGKGCGTESVGALVDYLFLERAARRVDAEVFTFNPASRRLLEKLGFTLEGTLVQGQAKGDTRRNLWVFGITRESWERRRA